VTGVLFVQLLKLLRRFFSTYSSEDSQKQQLKLQQSNEDYEKELRKAKLDNLLTYISKEINTRHYDKAEILFTFVKILSDKITIDHVNAIFSTSNKGIEACTDPLDLFFESDSGVDWKYNMNGVKITSLWKTPEIDREFTISLGKDAVITLPWNRDRVLWCINDIGSQDNRAASNKRDENHWTEKGHSAILLLPMGVTFMTGCLHSTFVGLIKRDGVLTVSHGEQHKVFDISKLYSHLRFDGTSYLLRAVMLLSAKLRVLSLAVSMKSVDCFTKRVSPLRIFAHNRE